MLRKVETLTLCKHMEWRIVRNMVTKTSIAIMVTASSLVTKLRSTPWTWGMLNQQVARAEITWRAAAKQILAQPSSAEVICTAEATCMERHLTALLMFMNFQLVLISQRAEASITVKTKPKAQQDTTLEARTTVIHTMTKPCSRASN
jgi:hypothetical protein